MIQAEPRGSILILRLDRPEKRNAQTPGMLSSLAGHLDTASSARAIVLSCVGPVFCAGFDLSLALDDPEQLRALLRQLARACRALRAAPAPVVTAAPGAAIAGGCALVCASDFVVTDEGASLGYPAVRLGISPAVSGPHLAASAGTGPARARLLDPGLADARGAYRAGLVSEVVATPEACEPRAIAIAEALAAKPPHALGYTKAWLNRLDQSTDPDRLDAALAASLSGVGSAEQVALLREAWSKPRRPERR